MKRGPLPVATVDDAAFWHAAVDDWLCLPRCVACSKTFYPPPPRCPICLTDQLEWHTLPPAATLLEWTRVHLDGPPGLGSPFVVARVALDAAPEVTITSTIDADVRARRGMPLRIAFERLSGDAALPILVAR